MIIVTLSGVCTLKCTCQYTLFDVGVLRYMNTIDQEFYRFQVLKAMYVNGICGFYTYLPTENYSSHLTHVVSKMSNTIVLCMWPLASASREGYLFNLGLLWA